MVIAKPKHTNKQKQKEMRKRVSFLFFLALIVVILPNQFSKCPPLALRVHCFEIQETPKCSKSTIVPS